jgi:enterobactin synthetase component D
MRNRSNLWRFDMAATAAMPECPLAIAWPAPGGELMLYLAAVVPALFRTSWFAQHNIAHPSRIVRSVPRRQAEFFAGRLCARAAIEALGVPGTQVETGVLGAPTWPAGLIGSISHSSTLSVALVLSESQCRGIGIDLEIVPDRDGLEALRAVALNAAERRLIARASEFSEDVLTTLVFSAKESFFKATAIQAGRYFDFSAIECVNIGTDTLTCVVREPLAPALQPGLLCRFEIALGGRHVLTCFRW